MKKTIIVIAAILIVGIIFLISTRLTGKTISEDNIREFTLDASRFEYNPDTIIVNKDDKVRIIINNIDTQHGIRIPEYNVKNENQVEFTANKQGEFDFYCTVYCGDEHKEMKGKLIVK